MVISKDNEVVNVKNLVGFIRAPEIITKYYYSVRSIPMEDL